MKYSPVLWIRDVKKITKLTDIARKDLNRSWSRKTAEVIGVCLRNEAPLSVDTVKKFAEISQDGSDVVFLLPLLEKWCHKSKSWDVVGELATKFNLSDQLSPKFQLEWVASLEKENPFKAINVYKNLKLNSELGVQLYLRANQPLKAHQLAVQFNVLSSTTMKFLISSLQDTQIIQYWVDKWQAMTPQDLSWLHHSISTRNINVKIPKDLKSTVYPKSRVKINEKLQHLVEYINRILKDNPSLLNELLDEWRAAMSLPHSESLNQLVCSMVVRLNTLDDECWIRILRIVNFNTSLAILERLTVQPERGFAIAISRAVDTESITKILRIINTDLLYTKECMGALAQKNPNMFVELAIPPELIEAELNSHHLTSLWHANPSNDVIEWLYPLTLKNLDSLPLLRAAVYCLKDEKKRRELLHEFIIVKGLEFDITSFTSANKKVSKPRQHSMDSDTVSKFLDSVHAQLNTLLM